MSIPVLSSPPWSSRTKRAIVFIILALVLLGLWQLSSILWLVIIALLLGYLFLPLVNATAYLLPSRYPPALRRTSAVLLTGFVIAGVAVGTVLVMNALYDQTQAYLASLPDQLAQIGIRDLNVPATLPDIYKCACYDSDHQFETKVAVPDMIELIQ